MPLQQGHCRTAPKTMKDAGWQFLVKKCIPQREDMSLDVVLRARQHQSDANGINKALHDVWAGSDFNCPPPPPKLILTPSDLDNGGGEPKSVVVDGGLLSPQWQPEGGSAAPTLEERGNSPSKPKPKSKTSCSATQEPSGKTFYTTLIAVPKAAKHCGDARDIMWNLGWDFTLAECKEKRRDKSALVKFRAEKRPGNTDVDINQALNSIWKKANFKCPPPRPAPEVVSKPKKLRGPHAGPEEPHIPQIAGPEIVVTPPSPQAPRAGNTVATGATENLHDRWRSKEEKQRLKQEELKRAQQGKGGPSQDQGSKASLPPMLPRSDVAPSSGNVPEAGSSSANTRKSYRAECIVTEDADGNSATYILKTTIPMQSQHAETARKNLATVSQVTCCMIRSNHSRVY